MQINSNAKLLRIFIGESDKIRHKALYEVIVCEARKHCLAGATAWKGIIGFGANSRIRTSKILDLSNDLPIIIEISDEESKINSFLPILDSLFEEAKCGGLITLENISIIKYVHNK
ncbi:MAG TPA: DUF190 domain-containing protein [Victivallales bacterium]|nr:DUF190 domain-containing protein [Victivallales bacterium]HPO91380.1 DUF190 domain-containing protein [Victivallales bacterium]HRR06496.1 DUF190 domain-containing protein [Victivallales bacterium]HRR29605.1 DUF190 domain-containing protein [Victivallales bacterium]HRU00890.1 DUF190 domain-containing protein [Victivallales bacterium]